MKRIYHFSKGYQYLVQYSSPYIPFRAASLVLAKNPLLAAQRVVFRDWMDESIDQLHRDQRPDWTLQDFQQYLQSSEEDVIVSEVSIVRRTSSKPAHAKLSPITHRYELWSKCGAAVVFLGIETNDLEVATNALESIPPSEKCTAYITDNHLRIVCATKEG